MLHAQIISWFVYFPREWAVFFIAMLPIAELRAAIPIGLEVYQLPIWKVEILAILGNMFPTIFILLLMPKLHEWMIHKRFLGSVLIKKIQHIEKAFSGQYAKYGALALILFVGIPLPFTGAWTGSLAAFIFDIPFRKSWWMILCGVCLAAIIVTFITLFATRAFGWLA